MAVRLALTPDRRWAATPAELVAAASRAGFEALGAWPDLVDDTTVAAYDAAGLACHELLALAVGEDDAATLTTAETLAAAAAAIGAEWVLTVILSSLTTTTIPLIRQCAALLAAGGAGIAVEFSPLGPVATITEGLKAVRAAERGGARAGLLVDTWHFFHGPSTWEDLASVPLDSIAYVQFDDALAPQPGASLMAETLHRRALPGDGVLELDRFAATLLDRGWAGTVSAEVLSADLRSRPLAEIVGALHETTARYWT